jgi:3-oxoacyl-[acyl-carrier protein] reductase
MRLLEGKVAIITGSGRGLGRCEALLFAREGAAVVVNDLGGASNGVGQNSSPADQVVAEIRESGGVAVPNYDTVATPSGSQNIINTALQAYGKIDIMVNNAGILRDRMVFNMTDEEWEIIQKVHLYGHFYCTRAACVEFRKQRSGRIINTSSQSGLGNAGQANYSAAKEGIVGLTRSVALDMARYGVTVNCIRPLAVTRLLTPELKTSWDKQPEIDDNITQGLNFGKQIKSMPSEEIEKEFNRMAPEHIAPLVVYLATDAAANINGKTFFVGGGEIGLYSEPAIVSSIFKDGFWSVKELVDLMPKSLTKGFWPAPAPK